MLNRTSQNSFIE